MQLTQNIQFLDIAEENIPLTDIDESEGSSQATISSSSTQGISKFEFNIGWVSVILQKQKNKNNKDCFAIFF